MAADKDAGGEILLLVLCAKSLKPVNSCQYWARARNSGDIGHHLTQRHNMPLISGWRAGWFKPPDACTGRC
ncbi:hypothetical protein KCP73_23655 [Salmonella enterica subsp. enterica]|nr:hypothetical protein KCP73_23655 [Salmonella enterica subsp. enterica]